MKITKYIFPPSGNHPHNRRVHSPTLMPLNNIDKYFIVNTLRSLQNNIKQNKPSINEKIA